MATSTKFQDGYAEAMRDILDALRAGGIERVLSWIADNTEGATAAAARNQLTAPVAEDVEHYDTLLDSIPNPTENLSEAL